MMARPPKREELKKSNRVFLLFLLSTFDGHSTAPQSEKARSLGDKFQRGHTT